MENQNVKPAEGKLGIMVVGLGAVSSTFMTGVLMARKGLAKPVGSMTQYDKIRVGRGADKKYLSYGEIVPMAKLDDIVFGAWDVYPANAFQSAMYAEVLQEKDILPVKDELEKIVPMKAAFDKNFAKRLTGDNVKDCKTRWDMVEQIRQDIRQFKADHNCARIVVAWAASTEIYVEPNMQVHDTLAHLEAAMKADDRQNIAPSMCYAYAALAEGAPFIMGAPNTTVDIPAMWEMSEPQRLVLYQHPRQPRRTCARRASQLPYEGGQQTFHTRNHPQARCTARPLRPRQRHRRPVLPQGAHQLLSSAQRQQGGLGQHRHLWLDELSHAD